MKVNQILLGDALELIKEIPDESIDVCITDPPYGVLKKGIRNDSSLDVYYKIVPEIYRVLKKDSFFVVFTSTKFLNRMFKIDYFKYVWTLIMYTPHSMARSSIGFSKYDPIIVFKKGNPNMKVDIKDVIISESIKKREGEYVDHPSPKPLNVVERLVEKFTKEGDVVLDPFMGSGTTAIACILKNRKFVGFEIEEKYWRLANERIEKYRKKGVQRRLIV